MKTKAPRGKTPAVVLENPKFPRNAGFVLRNAYNFGVQQMWITGDRVPASGYHLPREERFKEYRVVDLLWDDRPLDRFDRGVSVIGVELVPGAIPITYFEHPKDAVYVFGPEDGNISKALRVRIHQFIFVPTLSCLNLAVITGVVFADRLQKEQLAGEVPVRSMEETLSRYNRNQEQDEIDVFDPI